MDINTCFATTSDYYTLSYYTHYLPIFVSLFLGFYLLFKTNYSLLSRIFLVFVLGINVWLVADLVAWTSQDYNLIHFFWSFFDYTNTLFFLFGLYFFIVLIRQKDINWKWKLGAFALTLPAFYVMVAGSPVHEFDQTVCESVNDPFLGAYKNYVELFVILTIIFLSIRTWIKEKQKGVRNQVLVVALGLLLFFITFALTDYFSVTTDYYEFGLYGLFILPVFLGLIVYSIVKYKTFNTGVLGAQALVVTLIVLVGAQFFFIQNNTNKVLNAMTFFLVIFFGYFLVKGVQREIKTREQLEKLTDSLQHANERLKELDQQKTEFISLATHQIRGPLAAIKGYASMVIEGDYGAISENVKKALEVMAHSAQALIIVVNDYLDVSRIEQGRMKYDFSDFDLKDLVKTVFSEFQPTTAAKHLELVSDIDESQSFMVYGDMGKLKQVFGNLLDNSIKYTPTGSIHMALEKKGSKILFSIKDTGVGINAKVIPQLFEKFSRAPDASKTNILGTGLGLFVAKKMIEAHKGRIWAESEGEKKGAQFYVELQGK